MSHSASSYLFKATKNNLNADERQYQPQSIDKCGAVSGTQQTIFLILGNLFNKTSDITFCRLSKCDIYVLHKQEGHHNNSIYFSKADIEDNLREKSEH